MRRLEWIGSAKKDLLALPGLKVAAKRAKELEDEQTKNH